MLNELRARRVITGSFVAKGYGEESPVASNDTEEGREANRRIEFKLINEGTSEDSDETALENGADTGDTDTPSDQTQEGN